MWPTKSSRDAPEARTPVLECRGLWKVYKAGRRVVKAVADVSLSIDSQEFVVLKGGSGSGKSTLLNLIGGLDVPTQGTVSVLGLQYSAATAEQLGRFRHDNIGFVFQELSLVPHLTAYENVALPRMFEGLDSAELAASAMGLLTRVGLASRWDHFPKELSVGERQRVVIARALITNPKVILADEPTASLDDTNAVSVLRILQEVRQLGATVVVATHDPRVEAVSDRQLELVEGRLHDGHGL